MGLSCRENPRLNTREALVCGRRSYSLRRMRWIPNSSRVRLMLFDKMLPHIDKPCGCRAVSFSLPDASCQKKESLIFWTAMANWTRSSEARLVSFSQEMVYHDQNFYSEHQP